MSDVTRILSAIEQGDPSAADQLLPLVYNELRQLAAAKLAQEKPGQTLQATALVHEAYLRLVDVEKAQHFNSRGHFFAAAAEAMRRILVERARQKGGPNAAAGARASTWRRPSMLWIHGPTRSSRFTAPWRPWRASHRSRRNWSSSVTSAAWATRRRRRRSG